MTAKKHLLILFYPFGGIFLEENCRPLPKSTFLSMTLIKFDKIKLKRLATFLSEFRNLSIAGTRWNLMKLNEKNFKFKRRRTEAVLCNLHEKRLPFYLATSLTVPSLIFLIYEKRKKEGRKEMERKRKL